MATFFWCFTYLFVFWKVWWVWYDLLVSVLHHSSQRKYWRFIRSPGILSTLFVKATQHCEIPLDKTVNVFTLYNCSIPFEDVPWLFQAAATDFVRWLVQNPLLDVLVKNKDNEDAAWNRKACKALLAFKVVVKWSEMDLDPSLPSWDETWHFGSENSQGLFQQTCAFSCDSNIFVIQGMSRFSRFL